MCKASQIIVRERIICVPGDDKLIKHSIVKRNLNGIHFQKRNRKSLSSPGLQSISIVCWSFVCSRGTSSDALNTSLKNCGSMFVSKYIFLNIVLEEADA